MNVFLDWYWCETRLNPVSLAFQYIYGCSDEGGENGEDGNEISRNGENGDYLVSCMQMTWFYVVSLKKTQKQWWDILFMYAEEDWKQRRGSW